MTTTIYAKTGKKFKSIGYYSAELIHQIYAANTATFESTTKLEEQTTVIVRGKHKPFKGVIQKRTESPGYYSYDCIDGQKRLFGVTSGIWNKLYPHLIVKQLLRAEGFSTAGVEKSKKKIPKLVWNNTKLIDIIEQLAVLDNKTFYFNQDGIPIWKTPTNAVKGYVFLPEQSISDYSFSYDNSNIITDVMVFGVDDTYLARVKSDKLIAKYGDILELISDSNIKNVSKAREAAKKKFKEKSKVKFAGNLILPQIINIGSGEWCAMAKPKWQKGTLTPYYIQKVTTKIDENTEEQTAELLDGLPTPPDEYIYIDPEGNVLECTTTATTGVGGHGICSCGRYINPTGTYYWLKKCPSCGSSNLLYQPPGKSLYFTNKCPKGSKQAGTKEGSGKEGMIYCCNCDWDACVTCGYEHIRSSKKHLTRASGTGSTKKCGQSSGSVPYIGNAFVPRNPRDIRLWIDQNIKYSFYFNYKWLPKTVVSKHKGNCMDQARLFRDMVNGYFPGKYKMEAHNFNVVRCGTYSGGHQNTYIWINGRRYTADTTCSGQNTL